MFRRILSKKTKSKETVAEEEKKISVDLSKCLAQVQEVLGKLRQGHAGEDPFPSLNEASRIVTVMASQVEQLPAEDQMKEIWMEQVSEAQQELQSMTDRMVFKVSGKSKNGGNLPESGSAQPATGGSGGDDMFSGLMMSTNVTVQPATAAPAKNETNRPELDPNLFSHLALAESAKVDSPGSRIPASPSPGKVKQPEGLADQTRMLVQSTSSPGARQKTSISGIKHHGVDQGIQHSPLQLSSGTKKKKRGHRVGYGREPEIPAVGKVGGSTQTQDMSGGEAADAHPASKQLSQQANGGQTLLPSVPIVSSTNRSSDHIGSPDEAQTEETNEGITLEGVVKKAKECNSQMSEALGPLSEKERRLMADRTELLLCLNKGKEQVSALEVQQAAAVQKEDFEKAASLAVDIDAQMSRIDRCQQDISEVEKSMRSCNTEKTMVLDKAKENFGPVVAQAQQLREECEGSGAHSKAEKEQELQHVEEELNKKKAAIKEIESCIPKEHEGIAASRLTLEEDAHDRKQERLEKLSALQQKEEKLKDEIEALKAELCAKESSLTALADELKDLNESEDEEFKTGLAQLSSREALLAKEENRLQEMKAGSSEMETKCEETRKAAAVLEKEHKKRMEQCSSTCSMFEEELETLSKGVQREKDCAAILASLLNNKADAVAKRQDLHFQCKQQADQLKDLGSHILSLGSEIRGLEEEIGKAEVRLPEIEKMKNSAAAVKDFKEAATLSSQAKEVVAQKEAAEQQLTQRKTQLSDGEESREQLIQKVSSLEEKLGIASREAALAQYTQLKADLKSIHIGIVAKNDNCLHVIEEVCKSLASEFGFDEAMVADTIAKLEKLS